ncbi:hypothetical protein B0H16DRAFT_1512332 [Mycena metata]|uniref:Uncharacterized protein n=1 Tax=Mycena metata TaxID=1033252 RepID=A0AAD7JWV9_9AGAR|nr:hypothetical protein B0H16DRAFT_1512332 [Mycena metata]
MFAPIICAILHHSVSCKRLRLDLSSSMILDAIWTEVLGLSEGHLQQLRQSQDDKKPSVQMQAPTIPSVALMGISHLGDLTSTYRTERYPSIEFVDSVGHSRKAKGGILLFTRSAQGCFSTMLEWDSAAFPPGLVEEFWGHFVGGVHEFVLDGAPLVQVKL